MEKRTLPCAIYTLSPDGIHAVTTDFDRINNLRRGYGLSFEADKNQIGFTQDLKIDLQI